MFDNYLTLAIPIVLILVALIIIGIILTRLYRRSSKEVAFVRTGFGGQKVIVDGGALVLPILHEIIPVNMNTLRLEVRRANEQALITRDRMRVDVQAEFYVRVQPTAESIANAAQTLGQKTMHPDQLKDLVEGKFVDSLRAVAAEMAMEELHEQRVNFVQKVQMAVTEDLLKNGLELETVSLTGLDQTNREFFNPNNAFDAEGLTKLTMEIEEKRRRRNDIEQDTEVAVRQKNLQAEKLKLDVARDEEYARLQQQQEIAIRRAEQQAGVTLTEALKQREAEQARIQSEQGVQQSRILAERQVEEDRIEKERLVREKDIARERSVQIAEVEKRKTLELAEQERVIAIAEKSQAQSQAEAAANAARAAAVRSEEAVTTVRETEIAERQKAIELVEARKAAERDAIGQVVAAETEKQAAEDRAEAIRVLAHADAERHRIAAEGESEADKLRAAAAEIRYAIDATGRKALNEAENILSSEIVALRLKLALLERLPEIIAQSVKPMERIDGIKIIQVDGITGGGSGSAAAGEAGGNLADQLVSTALRYRGQAPLVDALLNEIGLSGGSLDGLVQAARTAQPPAKANGAADPGGIAPPVRSE
ncbi:putative membrane protein YqiK [Inquilinus ginsengisoli]|uniref:flotillin family protein n=1 Tax=Inquilinus ginsengisoli TaxID=363840 RepID=UPI003D1DC943